MGGKSNNKVMKCLFIGPLANHAVIGRVAAFASANLEMYLVDACSVDTEWLKKGYPIPKTKIVDYWKDSFYRSKPSLNIFKRELLRILGLIPEENEIVTRINKLCDDIRPDFFVTHYGAYAIHFARILKRSVPNIPVINIINLIPSSVNFHNGIMRYLRGWSGSLESLNYKCWLRQIDGVFYANQLMYDYARNNFNIEPDKSCILPDFLPVSFFSKNDNLANSGSDVKDNNPKVIYLGAPERFGEVIDSLDDHFLELAAEKIHIFSGAISKEVTSTGFGHSYPNFSNEDVFDGQLANYASKFDAALIAYNVPKRQERFRTTFPTRLFSAIASGLPLAVRGGILDACENFVTANDIGFVYRSSSDLREILKNKSIINRYRQNIFSLRHSMTAESQSNAIMEFIYRIKI